MHSGPTYTDADRRFMADALELAGMVKGTTFPNPAVGAVVVNDGAVVGRGATAPAGGAHAEIRALQQAGNRSRGATLYVTLEPCCHWGRTGPCTDAIVSSGISTAVVAVRDPNPLVAGKGIRTLRRHGIDVRIGLLSPQAARLNEDFFWSVVHRRAWVSLKLAMTLDGRIADAQDGSRWITARQARSFVHELRSRHAAVAVGNGTFVKDDPLLTVRKVSGASPARVVFVSKPRIPARCRLKKDASEIRTILVVSARQGRSPVPRNDSIEVWYTGTEDRAESARRFLSMAFDQGLPSVFVEGGQILASVMMENGLVNRVYFFYGNSILGSGRAGFLFGRDRTMRTRIPIRGVEVQLLGSDVMMTGLPDWGK